MGTQENTDQAPNDLPSPASYDPQPLASLDQGAKQNAPRPAEKND
jgi:hypothetical protein